MQQVLLDKIVATSILLIASVVPTSVPNIEVRQPLPDRIDIEAVRDEYKPLKSTFNKKQVITRKEVERKPEPTPVQASPTGSCKEWIQQAGVQDVESAYALIMRESGCNPNATNPTSGAFGLPQALPASKISHCGSNPVCQIKWMDSYCKARYGSWAAANSFQSSNGWY